MSLGGWALSEVAHGYAWDSCWAFREYGLSVASASQGCSSWMFGNKADVGSIFLSVTCHLHVLSKTQTFPFSVTLSNLIIFSKPHCTSHKNMKKLAPTSEHCFEVYMTIQGLSERLFQWIHFILRRYDWFAMLKIKFLSCLELRILNFFLKNRKAKGFIIWCFD